MSTLRGDLGAGLKSFRLRGPSDPSKHGVDRVHDHCIGRFKRCSGRNELGDLPCERKAFTPCVGTSRILDRECGGYLGVDAQVPVTKGQCMNYSSGPFKAVEPFAIPGPQTYRWQVQDSSGERVAEILPGGLRGKNLAHLLAGASTMHRILNEITMLAIDPRSTDPAVVMEKASALILQMRALAREGIMSVETEFNG